MASNVVRFCLFVFSCPPLLLLLSLLNAEGPPLPFLVWSLRRFHGHVVVINDRYRARTGAAR